MKLAGPKAAFELSSRETYSNDDQADLLSAVDLYMEYSCNELPGKAQEVSPL